MRKKKKQPVHVSFMQPILASMLLATSVPLISLASARSNADTGSTTPVYQQFTPRSDQTGLFDRAAQRRAHRDRYAPQSANTSSVSSSSSADAEVAPCASATSASTSSASTMLRYDDLSDSEKSELRKQLRIGGCPYDVLPGYRQLCELMLKQRQEIYGRPSAPRAPLRNSRQERFSENID